MIIANINSGDPSFRVEEDSQMGSMHEIKSLCYVILQLINYSTKSPILL
ncbi:hypothetical protein F8388_025638 [Cannabis sativa]|uniref:Uncharacterized protein n=1 Tax=Cannabis sativa TaxID=3483 RepID=A0A7J6G1P5_CANSA|nr:hypothetical protein F8388_025638 [Cannabis sativa]